MELQEKLNLITNNKYGFDCKSAVLDSNAGICFLEFYYNDGTILTAEVKDLCGKAITEFLPEGFGYNVKYIKNFVTEDSIRQFIVDFILNSCPSIAYIIDKIEISDISVIYLLVAEEQQDYVKSKKLSQVLALALKNRFECEFKINILYKPNMIDFTYKEEDAVIIDAKKFIKVTDKNVVVGTEISNDATYIRDSKICNNVIVICGHISNIQEKFTKPKVKQGEDAEQVINYFKNPNIPLAERKEAGQRQYFKFKLTDFTDEILCTYFPKAEDVNKFKTLVDGQPVIVMGEVKEDMYNGVNLKITNISTCTLPKIWEEEIDYKSEKDYYEFVSPEDVVYTNQVGLFSMFDTPKIAPFLKDNEFVVFDFETTGLNPYNGDKIVEIGAVKVINGIICQKFRSLVNPEMHIPEDSSRVHGIFDEDVVDSPTAEKVLQDFYKFTRGCILVGYNVNFDYSFLIKQGKESRYNFTAKTFDVLDLARQSIKGLKHYKLKDVCKYLGVTLDNAHSAIYDTIATAEVLIKLADQIN